MQGGVARVGHIVVAPVWLRRPPVSAMVWLVIAGGVLTGCGGVSRLSTISVTGRTSAGLVVTAVNTVHGTRLCERMTVTVPPKGSLKTAKRMSVSFCDPLNAPHRAAYALVHDQREVGAILVLDKPADCDRVRVRQPGGTWRAARTVCSSAGPTALGLLVLDRTDAIEINGLGRLTRLAPDRFHCSEYDVACVQALADNGQQVY